VIGIVVVVVSALAYIASTTPQMRQSSQSSRFAPSTTLKGCTFCIVNPPILPCGENGRRYVTVTGWSSYCATAIDSLSFFPWHLYNASQVRDGTIIFYFSFPPCGGPFNSPAWWVLPNGTDVETLFGANTCVVNGTTTVAR